MKKGGGCWQRTESTNKAPCREAQKWRWMSSKHICASSRGEETAHTSLPPAECCSDPGWDTGSSSSIPRGNTARSSDPRWDMWGNSDTRWDMWSHYMYCKERVAGRLARTLNGRGTQLFLPTLGAREGVGVEVHGGTSY